MIEIIELSKHYGPPGKRITAVDKLSFTIESGIIFGLLGPNGAGKTTTIKMLTAVSRPDSGTCLIDGFDIFKKPLELKERIGVVPQENNLDRELTAYENLKIYAMLHRVENAEAKIGQIFSQMGLSDRQDLIVTKYSGGMQRRLLLARALLREPAVLFLDEPSIGLDPQIRRQMWDIIRETKTSGRTVIITTHYIEEAEALCDRIAILSKGRLIALDTPAGLKARIGGYAVEFMDVNGKISRFIAASKDEAHDRARSCNCSVTIRPSNLEDVFIELTGERIE
ncbi:MAG: ABC transporter [Deltaproteobacteria bacterium RIFOXYD12_FULL_50_9]|nr:MAG: ABC transporter [Deltaproteobacteria bacterium RIFOXYD12_FULL_50_9]